MHDGLIAFGSNLGDSQKAYLLAESMLAGMDGVLSVQRSDPFVTRPVGGPAGQNDYVNGCFHVVTNRSAEFLFAGLAETEASLGRERRIRWDGRTADLDLLLFDQQVHQGALIVPHPRMTFRRFVLEPAAQIAADMVHPLSGCSVAQLLAQLNEKPNCMGLVGEKAVVANLMEGLAPLCASRGWSLRSIPDRSSLQRASDELKLVLRAAHNCDDRDLIHAARTFGGPTLDLESSEWASVEVEVLAAIDAMAPTQSESDNEKRF